MKSALTPGVFVNCCCPVHGRMLDCTNYESWSCPLCAVDFPVRRGVPILLPQESERLRVAGTGSMANQARHGDALAFYNRSHDEDQYFREHIDDVRADVEHWLGEARTTGPVLEIGSGKGPLQGIGAEEYIAFDYSLTALTSFVSERFQRVCGNAANLPFPDGSFRFVFTVAALEHVPAAHRAFAEIHRILKPGGVAYVFPAWHCVWYNCEGIPVRPYAELNWRQRFTKFTLPLRRNLVVKALSALPGRLWRRCQWVVRRRPTRFRFQRLRPDYERFWMSDSDAAASLDSHEGCLFFHSRGYEILHPGASARKQLFARHVPVVVRKRS